MVEFEPERVAYELLRLLPLEEWDADGGVPVAVVDGMVLLMIELAIERLPGELHARVMEHLTAEELAAVAVPHVEALAEGRVGAAAAADGLVADLRSLLERGLGPV